MDTNQIAQMIEWLDEERRRDKSTIATLEERLAQQQTLLDNMQRRVNSVESDQTVMKEDKLSAQREQEILDTVRKEMRQLLENTESRRLAAEREGDRRTELVREAMQRSIQDIKEKTSELEKKASTVGNLQTEGDRLTNSVAILQQRLDDLIKQLEEPDRRITFLEEQRRQDARRLSETETEIPDVKKDIDSIRPRVSLIEDLAIRNERRIQELSDAERDRRDEMQQFVDQQQLIQQQRDLQMDDLLNKSSEHDEVMQKNIERFEVWSQTHRDMKRIIDDFDRIGKRLERRINEVAEMQRLSEERFRQEWNDWRDDDQKRWKQSTLSNDDVWRNHDKEFEEFVAKINQIGERLPAMEDSLTRIWNLERSRAELYSEGYKALLTEHDRGSSPTDRQTDTTTNGT